MASGTSRSRSKHEIHRRVQRKRPPRSPSRSIACRVSWDDAFNDIGAHLKQLETKSVVFYASGRASLETSYLYQLFARLYGNNNLPDSSNMCHESTSVALLTREGELRPRGEIDARAPVEMRLPTAAQRMPR
jgi:predicted molibdopterin-dependent oxidoreductase YjgC